MKVSIITLAMIIPLLLSAMSLTETIASIDSLKTVYTANGALYQAELVSLEKTNPLLAPQDAFESDSEYIGRLARGYPVLQALKKEYLDDYLIELGRLRAKTFETDDVKISLGTYKAEREIYPLEIELLSHSKVRYQYDLKIDRDKARKLFENWDQMTISGVLGFEIDDSVRLNEVKIENKTFDIDLNISLIDISNMMDGKDFEHIYISPDTKQFFITNVEKYGNGEVYKTKVFDARTNVLIKEISGNMRHKFSEDGNLLIFYRGYYNAPFEIYNLASWENVLSKINFKRGNGYSSGCDNEKYSISPNNRYFALYEITNKVGGRILSVYNLSNGKEVIIFPDVEGAGSITFSPDGLFLAIAINIYNNNVHKVKILNLETQKQVTEMVFAGYIKNIAYSGDGKSIMVRYDKPASAGKYPQTDVINIGTKQKSTIPTVGERISYLALSYDRKYMGYFTELPDAPTNYYKVYNLISKKEHLSIPCLSEYGSLFRFSLDGRYLLAGNRYYIVNLNE